MVHLLDITFRSINNRRNVGLNRKINKQIHDNLFKENNLLNYLLNCDQDSIIRIYTLVEDVKELDPAVKINIKHAILEKYPDFKFLGEKKIEKAKRTRLIVTENGYERKQSELKHLIE